MNITFPSFVSPISFNKKSSLPIPPKQTAFTSPSSELFIREERRHEPHFGMLQFNAGNPDYKDFSSLLKGLEQGQSQWASVNEKLVSKFGSNPERLLQCLDLALSRVEFPGGINQVMDLLIKPEFTGTLNLLKKVIANKRPNRNLLFNHTAANLQRPDTQTRFAKFLQDNALYDPNEPDLLLSLVAQKKTNLIDALVQDRRTLRSIIEQARSSTMDRDIQQILEDGMRGRRPKGARSSSILSTNSSSSIPSIFSPTRTQTQKSLGLAYIEEVKRNINLLPADKELSKLVAYISRGKLYDQNKPKLTNYFKQFNSPSRMLKPGPTDEEWNVFAQKVFNSKRSTKFATPQMSPNPKNILSKAHDFKIPPNPSLYQLAAHCEENSNNSANYNDELGYTPEEGLLLRKIADLEPAKRSELTPEQAIIREIFKVKHALQPSGKARSRSLSPFIYNLMNKLNISRSRSASSSRSRSHSPENFSAQLNTAQKDQAILNLLNMFYANRTTAITETQKLKTFFANTEALHTLSRAEWGAFAYKLWDTITNKTEFASTKGFRNPAELPAMDGLKPNIDLLKLAFTYREHISEEEHGDLALVKEKLKAGGIPDWTVNKLKKKDLPILDLITNSPYRDKSEKTPLTFESRVIQLYFRTKDNIKQAESNQRIPFENRSISEKKDLAALYQELGREEKKDFGIFKEKVGEELGENVAKTLKKSDLEQIRQFYLQQDSKEIRMISVTHFDGKAEPRIKQDLNTLGLAPMGDMVPLDYFEKHIVPAWELMNNLNAPSTDEKSAYDRLKGLFGEKQSPTRTNSPFRQPSFLRSASPIFSPFSLPTTGKRTTNLASHYQDLVALGIDNVPNKPVTSDYYKNVIIPAWSDLMGVQGFNTAQLKAINESFQRLSNLFEESPTRPPSSSPSFINAIRSKSPVRPKSPQHLGPLISLGPAAKLALKELGLLTQPPEKLAKGYFADVIKPHWDGLRQDSAVDSRMRNHYNTLKQQFDEDSTSSSASQTLASPPTTSSSSRYQMNRKFTIKRKDFISHLNNLARTKKPSTGFEESANTIREKLNDPDKTLDLFVLDKHRKQITFQFDGTDIVLLSLEHIPTPSLNSIPADLLPSKKTISNFYEKYNGGSSYLEGYSRKGFLEED